MAKSLWAFPLVTFLIGRTLGMEYTPNSGCTSLCTDNSSQNISSITGSDIVCTVDEYQSSVVGQRFTKCINCLQNSSTSTSTENDIMWFLYNLRYALNTCIFATANASIPLTTSCSADSVCGPIETALQSNMNTPSISTEFSYCSANQNSFLGTFLGTCSTCLRGEPETLYLANFLVALHAGCVQRPPTGVLIGLDSVVFTTNPVNITAPIVVPSSSSSPRKRLSDSAIIGIAIGGFLFLVATVAILFILVRRCLATRKNSRLKSHLDERFGSQAITAPVQNSYYDPGIPKRSPSSPPYENFSLKRLAPSAALQMAPVAAPARPYSPILPEEEYYAQQQQASYEPANDFAESKPSYHLPRPTQQVQNTSHMSPASHPSISPYIPSPATTIQTKTPSTARSNSTAASRPKISPSLSSSGLPRAPSRNENTRVVATHPARLQTRRNHDLSTERGGEIQGTGISGPLIAVRTREQEEQELQRQQQRARRHQQGIFSPAPRPDGNNREDSESEDGIW